MWMQMVTRKTERVQLQRTLCPCLCIPAVSDSAGEAKRGPSPAVFSPPVLPCSIYPIVAAPLSASREQRPKDDI